MPIALIDSASNKVSWLDIPAEERRVNYQRAIADVQWLQEQWPMICNAWHECHERHYPEDKGKPRLEGELLRRLYHIASNPDIDFTLTPRTLKEYRDFKPDFDRVVQPVREKIRANPALRSLNIEELWRGSLKPEIAVKHLVQRYEEASITKRIVPEEGSLEEAAEREVKRRRLVLGGWTDSLAEQGVAFDATQIFRERTRQGKVLFGGKGMFMSQYHALANPLVDVVGTSQSPVEKLTLGFGFVADSSTNAREGRNISAYVLDNTTDKVLHKLKDSGLSERILQSFHTMAETANHDYVHSAVFLFDMANADSPIGEAVRGNPARWDQIMSDSFEIYSLITHRQTMAHLFKRHPGMKQRLVSKGVEFAHLMEQFREQAYRSTDISREEAQEMSQFMLSNYLQRMNTMISPSDPAMQPFIDAVEHFGPTPRHFTVEDIANSMKSVGFYDAPLAPMSENKFKNMPVNAGEFVAQALAGAYDQHPSQRVRANIKMWREILAHNQPDKHGEYTLSGYDLMRRDVGGLFQMINDADQIYIDGKVMSMAEITQRYAEEFNAMAPKLNGLEEQALARGGRAAREASRRAAQEALLRHDTLHIQELRELLPQLRELAVDEAEKASVAAFERSLDSVQSTSRFAPPQSQHWNSDSHIQTAQAMLLLAEKHSSPVAEALAPHVEAFTHALKNREILTLATKASLLSC